MVNNKDYFCVDQNGKVDVADKAFRDVVLKKNHAQVKLTFQEFEKVRKAHQKVNELYQ
jgi:hypothetical protein